MVADCGYIESTKVLTFKQYIHVYNEIVRQASAATSDEDSERVSATNVLDTSVFLMQYVNVFMSSHC